LPSINRRKKSQLRWFLEVYITLRSAVARGENPDIASYLAERAKLFGLVKTERKRHREKAALTQQIWEAIPLS
jgi:hypothetical protein